MCVCVHVPPLLFSLSLSYRHTHTLEKPLESHLSRFVFLNVLYTAVLSAIPPDEREKAKKVFSSFLLAGGRTLNVNTFTPDRVAASH